MIDRELQPDERRALRAWAERDVPGDFADEVLARWEAEREADAEVDEDDDVRPAVPLLARRRVEQRDLRLAWWCGMVAAAAAIALALTIAWPRRPHDPARVSAAPTPELAAMRAEAHADLLARCTPCHLARSPEAKAEAIAAFELGDPRWHDALDADQLVAAVDRMADLGDPGEAARFRRYVDAELAHRSTAAR